VTDDDGTIESGHSPDPGPGLGSAPDPPPGTPRPRGPRHLRIPLPGFGVAHPGTAPNPGGATDPGHSAAAPPGPATPPGSGAAASAAEDALTHPPAGAAAADPTTAAGMAAGGQAAAGQAAAGQAAPAPSAGQTGGQGATTPPDGATPPLDIDQIASQVYERIGDKMDHRPDTPQETPPAEQAIMLRDKAPELYDLWLKIAQEKAATINYVQRAPYEVPERLAQSGRPRALSAMILVLAFCGYLASLGGPGPYIGGLIAIVDLLVMLALFFGLRPDHLTDSGRPRKRRLIPRTY
jgi:hypothetical protein